MSYTLVIVESPAKCEKIEKFLGPGYKVLGSFGHITHLSNLKQIDFENNYKPNYEIIDLKEKIFNLEDFKNPLVFIKNLSSDTLDQKSEFFL